MLGTSSRHRWQPEAVESEALEQLRGERARKPGGYFASSHRLRESSTGISAESPLGDPNSWCMKIIAPCSCDSQRSCPESPRPHVLGRLSSMMSLLGSLAGIGENPPKDS